MLVSSPWIIPLRRLKLFGITGRYQATLHGSPHIHVFPAETGTSVLSVLPTTPPNRSLIIGTTTSIPPTPESFRENPHFLPLLQSVIKQHAINDPQLKAQAKVYASQAGSTLGGGRGSFVQQHHQGFRQKGRAKLPSNGRELAFGASGQGGIGGANMGGWIHVSDQRNPPDFGRTAEPEDIFGSLNVDKDGNFVGADGSYQSSGTYRIITREGILGLSAFLRSKLVERCEEIEAQLCKD